MSMFDRSDTTSQPAGATDADGADKSTAAGTHRAGQPIRRDATDRRPTAAITEPDGSGDARETQRVSAQSQTHQSQPVRPFSSCRRRSSAASRSGRRSSAGSRPPELRLCSPRFWWRSGAAVGVANDSTLDEAARRATDDASTIGLVGAIALVVLLFVAYFAGGYVAGRMARFSGAKQGLGVWLWALVVAVVVAIVGAIAGIEVRHPLRDQQLSADPCQRRHPEHRRHHHGDRGGHHHPRRRRPRRHHRHALPPPNRPGHERPHPSAGLCAHRQAFDLDLRPAVDPDPGHVSRLHGHQRTNLQKGHPHGHPRCHPRHRRPAGHLTAHPALDRHRPHRGRTHRQPRPHRGHPPTHLLSASERHCHHLPLHYRASFSSWSASSYAAERARGFARCQGPLPRPVTSAFARHRPSVVVGKKKPATNFVPELDWIVMTLPPEDPTIRPGTVQDETVVDPLFAPRGFDSRRSVGGL